MRNGFDYQWVFAIDNVLPTGGAAGPPSGDAGPPSGRRGPIPGNAAAAAHGATLPIGANAGINTTWDQLSSSQRRRFTSIFTDSNLFSTYEDLESAWDYIRSVQCPNGSILTRSNRQFTQQQLQLLRNARFTEEIINKFNQ